MCYLSKKLDVTAKGCSPCLQTIAIFPLLIPEATKFTLDIGIDRYSLPNISGLLPKKLKQKQKTKTSGSQTADSSYQAMCLKISVIQIKPCPPVIPATAPTKMRKINP